MRSGSGKVAGGAPLRFMTQATLFAPLFDADKQCDHEQE
jgi:hypothetical protein